MALKDYLYRNGEKIALEHASEVFTAILPAPPSSDMLGQAPELRQARQVFRNIYKFQAPADELDEMMAHMRSRSAQPLICHHAYCPAGDPATRYYLTDEITLRFQPGLPLSEKQALLQDHGLRYQRSYDEQHDVCLVQVTAAAGKNPLKVSNDLNALDQFVYAEPNLINRFERQYEPQDALYSQQWHLQRRGGLDLAVTAGVDAPRAWALTRGSRAITVALIDDGFDLSHPDLSGPGKLIGARDFADFDDDPSPEQVAGDFHGTPCAGIAIGEENGEGIVGIAPGCRFQPIRFPLSADDNLLYDIFEHASRYSDIISCSWGPVPVYAPLSSLLSNQMSRIFRSGGPAGKGCLVFFAAGNYNAPINDRNNRSFKWQQPGQGLRETTGPILNGYAAHPDVVAIAASTSLNRKSAYSNWGAEVTLCAPSDNWNPLNPQQRLPGRGIWTTDNKSQGLGFTPGSRYTGQFGGTSSACPLAAGAAALVRAANPELSAAELVDILKTTADKITDEQADPILGLRKGEYDRNGHSEWFGYGKINAGLAVEEAVRNMRPPVTEFSLEAVRIIAALANPAGSDTGGEKLMLINISAKEVDLQDWQIIDREGRTDRLQRYTLQPGSVVRVGLSRVRLSNTGGNIQIKNAEGQLAHSVDYTQEQAAREGWWIRF